MLLDFDEEIVRASEYDESNIGKEINRKVDVADLAEVFAGEMVGGVGWNNSIKDEDGNPLVDLSPDGTLRIYTSVRTKRAAQTVTSEFKIKKQRSLTK